MGRHVRRERPPADRLERGYGKVGDEGTCVRSSFESQVGVGAEPVRCSGLRAGLVLVRRHHGGAVGAQRSCDRTSDRAQPAELADDQAERSQRGLGGERLTDGCDTGAGAGLAAEQLQHPDRTRTAHTIDGKATVALEVLQRAHRRWTEDAVGSPAVESQLVERILQLRDVVAAQLRRREDQEPIAETPAGLDEREPGVLVADTADVQAAAALELGDRLGRGLAEQPGDVDGRRQPGSAQPTLEIANGLAALTEREREPAGQCVVARNSSSSWSRVPLLLAPTSRFDTSPPENTSRVGMLMTL